MEKFRIIQGDCLEKMQELETESVDLLFADPPYWMRVSGVLKRVEGTTYNGCSDEWDNSFSSLEDYANFTKTWLGQAKRVLKKNGSLWVIGSMQCIYTIGNALQELGFWLVNDVIWWKSNPTPNMSGSRLCNAHETLIWAVKSEKAKFTFHYRTGKELNRETVSESEYLAGVRKQMGSVWRFPVCSGKERLKNQLGQKLHSTQKPFALLHRIISLCSSQGDIVLDPFAGTFTTGAAAIAAGRRFIGIENSLEYCEAGKKRLEQIIESIGDIEKAVFDEKPVKMSVPDLLALQYLVKGEFLYGKDGQKARLLDDGKLEMPDGLSCDIHRGAAVISSSKAERLNGFNFWFAQRGNELVSLGAIREKARNNDKSLNFKRSDKIEKNVIKEWKSLF